MKVPLNSSKLATKFVLVLLLAVSAASVFAQESPLGLGKIMTALESTSSGMSQSQKNNYLITRVDQRGVTFNVTAVIEAELKLAGASNALIGVIKANGPTSNQTSTTKSTNTNPRLTFTKLWVDQNFVKDGRKGIRVHTNFTVYNLKDTSLQLTVRVQGSDGEMLKSSNTNFANKRGDLALYRNLKPGHDAAVYKDIAVFIPYAEMKLRPGSHKLKIAADVIYPEGKLLKRLALRDIRLTILRPSLLKPKGIFERMWVDFGVTEGELLGMRIHVKFKAHNLKGVDSHLKIAFEKEDGAKIETDNELFSDKNGGVRIFRELKPGHVQTVYNDLTLFMPYKELNLPKGDYKLRMHADLTYADGGIIQHLNNYEFTFKK